MMQEYSSPFSLPIGLYESQTVLESDIRLFKFNQGVIAIAAAVLGMVLLFEQINTSPGSHN